MTSIYRFLPQKVYIVTEKYETEHAVNREDSERTELLVYTTLEKAVNYIRSKAEEAQAGYEEDFWDDGPPDEITLEDILNNYKKREETVVVIQPGDVFVYTITEAPVL
jgi:hypothetical protein